MIKKTTLLKFLFRQIFLLSLLSSGIVYAQTGPNDDFDGDGIINSIDIDDDNDGVPDATESPNCYYTASEIAIPASVTTTVANSGTIANLYDNNPATLFNFTNGTTKVNLTVFEVTPIRPVVAAGLQIEMNFYGQTEFSNTAASLTMEGWNGTAWITLMPAFNPSTAPNTAQGFYQTFNFTQNQNTAYSKFRLQGLAGTIVGSQIREVKMLMPNNYIASLYPKTNCTDANIDGDNILPHFDLDSDGDGYSDALEAGATTNTASNYQFPDVDANNDGLVDAVDADNNGYVNYNSTYFEYALNKNISATADSDGDGIADDADLDDDNDGIPDTVECGSGIQTIAGGVKNLTETLPSGLNASNALYSQYGLIIRERSKVAPYNIVRDNFNIVSHSGDADNEYIFFADAVSYSFEYYNPFTNQKRLVDRIQVSAEPATDGSTLTLVCFDDAGTVIYTGTFPDGSTMSVDTTQTLNNSKIHRFIVSGSLNTTGFDQVFVQGMSVFAGGCDTDGDAVPNHLDLDSDGDGCSDLAESGVSPVTDVSTPTSITNNIGTSYGIAADKLAGSQLNPNGTDTNNNGLNDSVENGTTGTVSYPSTYNPYAIGSNYAACADTDGDGILDINDIDDDNDGVLDAVESPGCFYTAAEIAVPQSVTTQVATTGTIANVYDNNTATTFAFTNNSTKVNLTVFEITPSTTLKASALYIRYSTANANALGTTASSVSVDGWNGTAWMPLQTYTPGAAVANVQSFAIPSGSQAVYTKYRLQGLLGTVVSTGIIAEVGLTAASDYIPSAHPKPTCINDLDGDGILNHRDLDSDGDGCSDSVEAGNTVFTANNTTTYNTGADANNNGLLDQFESATTPGTINYASTYAIYASDATVSACLDSDGDGVVDIVDIDDDNDGILDIYEQQSFSCENTFGTENKLINWTLQNSNTATGTLTLNGETVNVVATTTKIFAGLRNENWGFGSGAYTGCPGSGDVAPNSAINIFSNDYTVTYTFSKPVKNPALSFSSYNGVGVSFSQPVYVSGLQGTVPTLSIGDYISSFPGTENTVSVIYHGVYNSISFTLTGADNQGATMLFIPEIKPIGTATYVNTTDSPFGYENLDTDGDGIFNHLDLDSDGDGCPDAQESGVTGTLLNGNIVNTSGTVNTANAVAQGPYGSNGLANPLENNDTASATTSFSSTYTQYALFKSLNNCLDSDNDGIKDLIDLDDDNDGVIDSVESPTCFFTQEEAGVIVSVKSSLSSPDDDQLDGDIQMLHDGVTASFTFNYTAGQAINGASLIIVKYPTAIQISQLSLVNSTTFGVGVLARLEGSQDGVTWANLGNGNVALDNTTNPKLFNNTNPGRYQYYRVLGTAGGNTVATTTIAEVNFVLAPFASSLHPKLTCTQDTDGDGILNHLDLDSDGDGCPDAVEAGTATQAGAGNTSAGTLVNTGGTQTGVANAIVGNNTPAAYGTNGFYSGIETNDTSSAAYTGIYTYNQYAIVSTLNLCTDTDGDGIIDLNDIDDDNDGIVDAVESPACFYTAAEANVISKITSQFTSPGDDQTDGDIQLLHDGATTLTFNFNAVAATANPTGSNLFTIEYPTSLQLATLSVSDNISAAGANAVVVGSNDGVTWSAALSPATLITTTPIVFNITTTQPYKYYRIQTGSVPGALAAANTIGEITSTVAASYIPSAHQKAIICSVDTDGDTIPNHLDLDSDGDGCSDLAESGVSPATDIITPLLTNNAGGSYGIANPNGSQLNPTAADTNNDGLNDSVDADLNSITNYTSTYSNAINAAIASCTLFCYRPAVLSGTVLSTPQGITSLHRAGVDADNWPMVRKGAWTALEAKTKGFVPNRLTLAQINLIPAGDLREGMMVYNISSDCLYINTDGTPTGWKCFNTQACPD